MQTFAYVIVPMVTGDGPEPGSLMVALSYYTSLICVWSYWYVIMFLQLKTLIPDIGLLQRLKKVYMKVTSESTWHFLGMSGSKACCPSMTVGCHESYIHS